MSTSPSSPLDPFFWEHGTQVPRKEIRWKETKGRQCKSLVKWSQEDGCLVGNPTPLIGPRCDGQDEVKVWKRCAF